MPIERFKLIPAVHIFLIRKDEILLLRRFNTGFEDGKYSVIAGHLDGNEQVKAAAIREAQEEAGIDISPEDMKIIGVMHRMSDQERIDFFVTVSSWQGDIKNMEPDKCDELAWYKLNELPVNTIPYVKKAIVNYHNGLWFDSFGWERVE